MGQEKTYQAPRYPVQTIDKALEVLEILSDEGYQEGLGVSELSNRLNIGKSTVHRILDTLLARNYIEQCEDTKKYRLGWRLFEIGNIIPQQRNLYNFDIGILQELCNRYEETVNLGVRVDDSVVTISKVSPKASLIANLQIGSRESLHATAMGKALICEMTKEEILSILGDRALQAYTTATIVEIDELLDELKKIRKQGFSVDDEEFCAGLTCIAMPVRDYKNEIVAAISVSGASIRQTYSKVESVKEGLKEATDKLSAFLGWQGEVKETKG
ncbi:DNA-binding transcriptional regulator, IclR family [Tindallia magadiensis]|uniref:Glycerol operon regulatory protein n=1 Tax=Tindallia magadiensis TaxID=69895 RepID=A0A1I3C187_9FIRM|nr:IclR family transcriptional regulator [Tindallia magadiensis]SFH68317.1 DNA-binding transcriptional regulator, IclR family [Tindallia magadiensis]